MAARHAEVLRRRLAAQLLAGDRAARAADVVARLTCVQSQEPGHGFWSLGMRMAEASSAGVQREFDAGTFVRTHILRPTWHFVAAADLRWILAVTSPRVHARNAGTYRQQGLDQTTLDRGTEVTAAALAGGQHLTRVELGKRLAAAGIPATGVRLAALVMSAELAGVICSGPMRGAQHTYALVDERIPPAPAPEDGVGELVRRFFVGHGPASLADFTRWSSLTVRAAQAGLDRVRERLEMIEVDGSELWSGPEPVAAGADEVWLLPLYDELTLSYPQLTFPAAPGHPHVPGEDLFIGCVVAGLRNVGLWKRTVSGRTVRIETWLAPGLPGATVEAVEEQRRRLADFLGLRLLDR